MVTQMIKRTLPWFAAVLLVTPLALPLSAHSAELKIEYEEPEHFSDIEPARENREHFRERTLEGIEYIFSELAKTLPDDQVFHVKVTNLDLAGYVDHIHRNGGLQPMRIVRQNEAPSIHFEYSLVDADGNVLQEGEERLRGRGMAEHAGRAHRAEFDHLRQEKEMIDRWFKRNFDE